MLIKLSLRSVQVATLSLILGGSFWFTSAIFDDRTRQSDSTISRSYAHTGSDAIVSFGADRFPSHSARDWVTYADHVVVVRIANVQELGPSQTEIDRGEGLIRRRLTMKVESVTWSSPSASKPAPSTFTWDALGWVFSDGDLGNRSEMFGEGAPRLELGHSYILAIQRHAAACGLEDGNEWLGIGASGILPYDFGTIGLGEYESQLVNPSASRGEWAEHGAILATSMSGLSSSNLRNSLKSTRPDAGARSVAVRKACAVVNPAESQ